MLHVAYLPIFHALYSGVHACLQEQQQQHMCIGNSEEISAHPAGTWPQEMICSTMRA